MSVVERKDMPGWILQFKACIGNIRFGASELRVRIDRFDSIRLNPAFSRFGIEIKMPPEGKKIQSVSVLPTDTLGGDRGIRTPDLRDANAALSRLSYIPILLRNYSIYGLFIKRYWGPYTSISYSCRLYSKPR
jgi:hypothetical protein